MYEIGKMTVKALQENLKSMEKDYSKVMNDGDLQIQKLKKEAHELCIKTSRYACYDGVQQVRM